MRVFLKRSGRVMTVKLDSSASEPVVCDPVAEVARKINCFDARQLACSVLLVQKLLYEVIAH